MQPADSSECWALDMPAKCCVPNCKSTSFTLDKVAFFSFPRDAEKRQEWLKIINKEGIVVKRSTVICSKHFEEKYLIREHRATAEDGKILMLPRDRIKLKKDAVPTMYILDQYTWTPDTNTNIIENDLESFDTVSMVLCFPSISIFNIVASYQ